MSPEHCHNIANYAAEFSDILEPMGLCVWASHAGPSILCESEPLMNQANMTLNQKMHPSLQMQLANERQAFWQASDAKSAAKMRQSIIRIQNANTLAEVPQGQQSLHMSPPAASSVLTSSEVNLALLVLER